MCKLRTGAEGNGLRLVKVTGKIHFRRAIYILDRNQGGMEGGQWYVTQYRDNR